MAIHNIAGYGSVLLVTLLVLATNAEDVDNTGRALLGRPKCRNCKAANKCETVSCDLEEHKYVCNRHAIADCCLRDVDCDDHDECTENECHENVCQPSKPVLSTECVECLKNRDCLPEPKDRNKCFNYRCVHNECQEIEKPNCDPTSCYTDIHCTEAAECEDATCNDHRQCEYTPIPGCDGECRRNSDCNDHDECTKDRCVNFHCTNKDNGACTPECHRNRDCNDHNKCTKDKCVDGHCVNDPAPKDGRRCGRHKKCRHGKCKRRRY